MTNKKQKLSELDLQPYYRNIVYLAKLEKRIFLMRRQGITRQDKRYSKVIILANGVKQKINSREREDHAQAILYNDLMQEVDDPEDEIQLEKKIFCRTYCFSHKSPLKYCEKCLG